jgi:hypothetical protein
MQRRFLNTTGMGATVAAYMNKNNTIWTGTKAVVDTMAQLNGALGNVSQTAQDQETPIVGEEDKKALARHDLEDEIMRIAGALGSLAAKTNDALLAGQTELTLAQLDKTDSDTLEETGNRISGLATTNLAALADYNILQADLTAFGQMISNFHDAKTGPRTAVAKRASKTKALPGGVKSVKSILRNQLDKEMLLFKKNQPDFYAGYLSARVIVDRGSRKGAAPTPPATKTATKSTA